MRMRRPLLALLAAALAAAPLVAAPTGAQAAVTVTVTPLHFKVNIGPTGSEVCDIVGDLYTPSTRHADQPRAGDPHDERLRRLQGRPGRHRPASSPPAATPC